MARASVSHLFATHFSRRKFCHVRTSRFSSASSAHSNASAYQHRCVELSDPSDPHVVLYRKKRLRNNALYLSQSRALAEKAIFETRAQLQHPDEASDSIEASDALIGVHFSIECLRRLRDAQVAGRAVTVHSVLTSNTAPEELTRVACEVAPVVYTVPHDMFDAEFQRKDVGQPGRMCSFVVAFPVSKPLADLRPPFIVLNELKNATNVGQILRTAFHLGVTSVVASRGAWENLGGRAARVSMGWLYQMDFNRADCIPDALQELRNLGIHTYAAENHYSEPVTPHTPFGSRRWALVVGNEDVGISDTSAQVCDSYVCVPQRGGESMNVAQATAICLYELGRHMES